MSYENSYPYFKAGLLRVYRGYRDHGEIVTVRADYGADAYIEFAEGARRLVNKAALSKPIYCHVGTHWSLPPTDDDYMCPVCREALDAHVP